MSNKECYLIAGGGTGGHINPALAVVEAARKLRPGAQYIFLSTVDGMEYNLINEAGEVAETISAAPLPGFDLFAWPRFIYKTIKGTIRSLQVIHKFHPRAVLGTGGYVCSPLILAARLSGTPYALHEQNAYPGKSNRLFAKHAKLVCTSFPGSEKYFRGAQCIKLTGNPIKDVFFRHTKEECRRKLGLRQDDFLVLLLGGSLGARRINQTVKEFLTGELGQALLSKYPRLKFAIGCGKQAYDELKHLPLFDERVFLSAYLDTGLWLPACDLFIGRSGASACFELSAAGKPSILIPYPHAAGDHQTYNAQRLVDEGAAMICKDPEFTVDRLTTYLEKFLHEPDLLEQMGEAAKHLADPEAAKEIAVELLCLGEQG